MLIHVTSKLRYLIGAVGCTSLCCVRWHFNDVDDDTTDDYDDYADDYEDDDDEDDGDVDLGVRTDF